MQRLALLPLALLFAACSDALNGPAAPPPPPAANPALGRMAFEQECSGCHASRDGFDLKLFGFSDTTIIRRAVAHVDTATARNIVAYIHSVAAPSQPENVRLFQPHGIPLNSDLEFALSLFGSDQWPAGLTTAQLSGIDPRTVRIAVRLPVWSDEGSNLDWMPDQPLPDGILGYAGSLVAAAIAGYRAAPTRENLVRAVSALRSADRAMANPDAPCLLDDTLRVDFRQCFEVRRWTSTLVALHLLRNGLELNLGSQVHDIWWDVGNAARKSRGDRSIPIANATANWASWMFLGWSFDPSLHASVYTGGGFRQLGLTRHGTFVALRSQVARARNSLSPYDDLLNAAKFAPASWITNVTAFGLRHLSERLASGDRPRTDQIAMAVTQVNATLAEVTRRAPAAEQPALQALAQQVLAALAQ